MHAFSYHRPTSLAEALGLLREHSGALALAGGMTLLPTLKLRLAAPDALVDLAALAELRGVRADGDVVEIGAMTSHADIAADVTLRARLASLATLAAAIGDPQVRNRGTIGGSVANNDPAADYPAAVLALDARIVTDRRELGADEFFRGMFETALQPGELITALRFPLPVRAAYAKFANPASRYAIAGVMVADTGNGVRVAVTGAGAGVFRATGMESALDASFSPSALDGIEVDPAELSADLHADPAYRARLVQVMARRAVEAALG